MPPHRSSRPPPPPHHGPRHGHSRRTSGQSSLDHTADIAALLGPFVRDEEDRDFVARCITTEGPAHHRLASIALLRLLGAALAAAGGPGEIDPDDGVPVPFRLPPHLERHADDDAQYPIRLSRRALERLAPADPRDVDALADALTDGPPHHALANVAMVQMLDALIERLSKKGGA